MKKLLLNIMLSFCTILIISGCGKNADIIEKSDEKISVPTVAISETTVADIDNDAIGGSTSECIHANMFNDSFHSFSYDLAKLVTLEKFDEWIIMEHESTDECPYYGNNIYEFIKYFAISREAFSNMYYTTGTYYTGDYNIDVLYGGNEDEVYSYYESGGNYEEMVRRSEDQIIKINLANYIGENKYNKWKDDNNYTSLTSWSIPEIIYEFAISEDAFKDIVNIHKNAAASEPQPIPDSADEYETVSAELSCYDYDYEKIFNQTERLQKAINDNTPGYKIDEMIRKL